MSPGSSRRAKATGSRSRRVSADRSSADIDFLQEIDNPSPLVFKLVKPLHIEEAPGPDLSFFEVEITGGDPKLAAPIALAAKIATTAERRDDRLSGL